VRGAGLAACRICGRNLPITVAALSADHVIRSDEIDNCPTRPLLLACKRDHDLTWSLHAWRRPGHPLRIDPRRIGRDNPVPPIPLGLTALQPFLRRPD